MYAKITYSMSAATVAPNNYDDIDEDYSAPKYGWTYIKLVDT